MEMTLRMKLKVKAGLFALLAAAAACISANVHEAGARTEAPRGKIELAQSEFSVKQWRSDGSHLVAVKGALTLDGQPVANAVLQAGKGRKYIQTAEDGSFELLVDRSLLAYTSISIVSVDEAKAAGKPIGKQEADQLLSARSAFSVYHPIQVTRVEPSASDASLVKVHARMLSEAGEEISFFQIDKYRIGGKVTDSGGKPLQGAVVWIDRDEGEGFAKSTPTDRDGKYELNYWPEQEETNLTVSVGTRRYTLPDNKVFVLPRNTSVEINIMLPREGTVIDDKPPSLVSLTSKGALYTGVLAGLNVPPGVEYSVTIPDREGRFVLTLPKAAWQRNPLFFETRLTKFVPQEKALKAGDALPSGFVTPRADDPKGIAAVRTGS